jgi:hypothetical protein
MPDIAFTVRQTVSFIHSTRDIHGNAVKNIICYLSRTTMSGISLSLSKKISV